MSYRVHNISYFCSYKSCKSPLHVVSKYKKQTATVLEYFTVNMTSDETLHIFNDLMSESCKLKPQLDVASI